MASFKKSLILLLCLATLCRSAPTETDSSTSESVPQAQVAPTSTPAPDSSSPVSSTEAGSSSSPITTTSTASSETITTTPAPAMAVASAQENHSQLTNSSFTCYARQAGYYADIDLECKVYHFCLPGKFNGEDIYQRISYLCLDGTLFDQQVLDCVKGEKLVAPCAESSRHFDSSNTVLRQALIGQSTNEQSHGANNTANMITIPTTSTTSTTPAPTSS